MVRPRPQFHPAFRLLADCTSESEPEFEIDFLGIRTRREYSAGAIITAMPVHTGDPHEDYLEWIDLLESILSAKGSYTMMELQVNQTPWGPVQFVDGVQSWINPARVMDPHPS